MTSAKLQGKRILVTGGSGFIGSHLVTALIARGAEVSVISTDQNPWRLSDIKNHIEYRSLSVNSDVLERAVRAHKPDIVFHLAALLPQRKPTSEELQRVIIHGTRSLVRALERVGRASHLVTLGAADEYGMARAPKEDSRALPRTSYGIAKRAATVYLRDRAARHSFNTCVLRPPIAYGPAQNFGMFVPNCIRSCIASDPFTVWGADLARDFLFVADLVDAMILAADLAAAKFSVFNVGSGKTTPLLHVAHTIGRSLSAEDLIHTSADRRSVHEPLLRRLDICKAQQVLRWRPGTSLDAGLEETIEWYRAHRALFPLLQRN
jgi:nucleoside-diphosphate-sugar epimerase